MVTVVGREAIRLLALVLPLLNARGATATELVAALRALAEWGTLDELAKFAAMTSEDAHDRRIGLAASTAGTLTDMPRPLRFALEMAVVEAAERQALGREIVTLDREWRAAEEIAQLSDAALEREGEINDATFLRHDRCETAASMARDASCSHGDADRSQS
ncbi:MAG: hypothetical protein NVS4B3_04640 [Gemmatimonadaceae bacterium]